MRDERLPVTSTRMNLKSLESRLKGIERGYSLLKTKSDALQVYFRSIELDIDSKQENLEKLFKDAFKSLNEAKLIGSDIDGFVMYCQRSPLTISTKIDYKFGVSIPKYQIEQDKNDFEKLPWKGGYKLKEAKNKFDLLTAYMVDFCSLQNAYKSLKQNLTTTNKRKNSLEYMMIPKIKSTAKWIEDELDEAEREEFFRLKKIQKKKFE